MTASAHFTYRLREACSGLFPVEGSNLALDICLAVGHYHFLGKTLTMKQLVYELPYSEAGIQYNLRQLRDEKWLEVEPSESDKRVRYLVPGQRLVEAFDQFMAETEALLVSQRSDAEDTLDDDELTEPRTAFFSPTSRN